MNLKKKLKHFYFEFTDSKALLKQEIIGCYYPDNGTYERQNMRIQLVLLQGVVLVLDFLEHVSSTEIHQRVICVNPPLLADIMCLLHIDFKKTNENLNIKKFWPQSTERPDPVDLVKSMEEVVTGGIVRETIVPLLLQVKYTVIYV